MKGEKIDCQMLIAISNKLYLYSAYNMYENHEKKRKIEMFVCYHPLSLCLSLNRILILK